MIRYSQKLKAEKEKQEFITTLKQGTVIAWRHIYFNGLYDFSEEKLTDSFDLLFSQNYDLFDRCVSGRPKHVIKLYVVRDRAILPWGINTVCYTMTNKPSNSELKILTAYFYANLRDTLYNEHFQSEK